MVILYTILGIEAAIFVAALFYTIFINPPKKEDNADVTRVLDYLE
jgi:hypothetical protein